MRRQSTQSSAPDIRLRTNLFEENEQFLGPKENFHPKRNQARQKLATLPPGRFKELAADVLYEIERRYPVTLETPPVDDRRTSNSSYNSQRNSDNPPFPTNGGSSFPPSTSRDRFPSNNSSGNITTIPEEPNEPSSETVAKSGMPTSIIPNKSMMVEDGSEEEDEEPTPKQQLTQPNRTLSNPKSPVAKTFMANTIVPNTSTMVEESPSDIEDDNLRADEDKNKTTSIAPSILSTSKSLSPPVFKSNAFANAGRQRSISPPPKLSPSKSINQIEEEHARRDEEMQDKIVQYEDKIEALKERIAELQHALKDSEESLRTERSKPPPVAPVVPASPTKDRRIKDLQDENDRLKDELREQQEVTIDVRREAMELLEEMKVLTSQHDVYLETQSSSSREMARLQSEIREWKSRYAQLKVQSRSIAATNGSHPSTPIRVDIKSRLVSEESGLIEMSSIQRFQSSIDELLVAARQRDTESEMMDNMTEVVKATRAITDDLKVGGRAGIEDEPRVKRLTARLSATANNLITATKNHVSSQGLSPVSLVDAAASHLANTVIELVKLVKLRPSNTASMRTDDETHSDRSHYSEIATPLTSPLAPNSPTSQQKPGPTPPKNIPGPLPLGSRSNLAPRTREEMYSPRSPESPRSFDSRRSSSRHQMSNKDDEELRLYLDDQTHAIVESIQSMLARIRNPKLDSIEDFRGQIEEIVSIVEKIVDHTDRQVAKVDRLAGDSRLLSVLRSMEDCCSAMKNVAKTSGSEDGFKKRLARIAFDISKQIKVPPPQPKKELIGCRNWFESSREKPP